MGKTGPDVYRAYINKMKKKTKEMRKNEDVRRMMMVSGVFMQINSLRVKG